MESSLPVTITVKTRLKKFSGEVEDGKEPEEVIEFRERKIAFEDLSPEMQHEVRKRWE